jgi:hypothetical protein
LDDDSHRDSHLPLSLALVPSTRCHIRGADPIVSENREVAATAAATAAAAAVAAVTSTYTETTYTVTSTVVTTVAGKTTTELGE